MSLIRSQRFLPLFLTQFFGAFNDNFLKNALVVMAAYRLAASGGEIGKTANLAAAFFILPYFIFSAFAGQLADKYDKARYVRLVKLAEILLMAGAAAGFLCRSIPLLLVILALMGTQSAFFSPAKYSLLPCLLKKEELLRGNAWIESGTYCSILAGAVAGSLLVCLPAGEWLCGGVLVILAFAGFLTSMKIPSVPSNVPDLKLDWNLFRQTLRILSLHIWKNRTVRLCVLSVSMFWMAGSLYIAQTPAFAKIRLGGDEKICTLFFVIFSVGVAAGASLANRLFGKRDRFSDGLLIAAILLMALLTFDLARIASGPESAAVLPCREIFRTGLFYRLSADFFLIAVCGGFWAIPLQTLMQTACPKAQLARVIAGNNIVNSFAMAFGTLLAAQLIRQGYGVPRIFLLLGIALLLSLPLTFPLLSREKTGRRT